MTVTEREPRQFIAAAPADAGAEDQDGGERAWNRPPSAGKPETESGLVFP